MIKYHKMNNTNIFDVVNEYVNYYNNCENGCWTKEKAYKRIHQIMSMDDSLCYLQYDDDKLVGFVMSYYKEFDDLKALYIEEIVVFKEYQNKGYGKQMMNHIEKEAINSGVEHIELLSVNDEHHKHFYESLGYYSASNLSLMGKHFK